MYWKGPCEALLMPRRSTGTDTSPSLQFAYNTARHTSTHETPFYLNYGRHPIVPADLFGDALRPLTHGCLRPKTLLRTYGSP